MSNRFSLADRAHRLRADHGEAMTEQDQIRADFARYTDRWGLLQPTDDKAQLDSEYGASGNGLTYTSAKILTYWRRGMLSDEDRTQFQNTVESCFQEPGLLMRSPAKSGDQEGWDDYVAVMAACKVAAPDHANTIRNYARAHGYVMNNERPGTVLKKSGGLNASAFLGRYPHLIAHMEYATGNSACMVNGLAWGLHLDERPEDHDGAYLRWMMILARFPNEANSHWSAFAGNISARYSGGMAQVWSEYFKNGKQPLAKWGVV